MSSPTVRARLTSATLAVGLVFGAAISAAISAAPTAASATTQATTVEYFKVPYGNDVYRVTNRGQADARADQLTFAQWLAAGQPNPKVMTGTQYVKYSWQADVYAVTFFGPGRAAWVWDKMSYAQWQQMGQPAPRNAGWIYGSSFISYPTDPTSVYVVLNGVTHHLTYNEWLAAGSPSPVSQANTGFIKLSWQGNIAKTSNLAAPTYASSMLTFNQWGAAAYPKPREATSFAGDVLYQSCNGPDLYYSGPTFEGKVSFEQWLAMGQRKPLTCAQARQGALNEANAYAAARGITLGAAVYDAKSGATYNLYSEKLYAANSTVKVFYAASLLKRIQDAGRAPNATEIDLINRAIRQSDNYAAASIFTRQGGQAGAEAYARYIGMSGAFFYSSWGRTDFSATNGLTSINAIMYGKSGLNASNRDLLVTAMQNVISSQRWGTPATGATVALKNGWDFVDNVYHMSTIHNVSGANRNYSVALYTENARSYQYPVMTHLANVIYRVMQ